MVAIMRRRAENAEAASRPSTDDAGPEPLEQLQNFEKIHKLDPNLPVEELKEVDAIIASGNAEKGAEAEAALVEENSPYPEVSKQPPRSSPVARPRDSRRPPPGACRREELR